MIISHARKMQHAIYHPILIIYKRSNNKEMISYDCTYKINESKLSISKHIIYIYIRKALLGIITV